jgi:hypothetical protein
MRKICGLQSRECPLRHNRGTSSIALALQRNFNRIAPLHPVWLDWEQQVESQFYPEKLSGRPPQGEHVE